MSLTEDNADFLGNVVSADAYRARNFAISAVEDDPERAAEAVRLADMTALPAAGVYADLDEVRLTQRRRATQSVVEQSPALQAYLNSHPMAAKVSNDDLDKLDEAGSTLRDFRKAFSATDRLVAAGKFTFGFLKGFDANTTSTDFYEHFGQMGDYTLKDPTALNEENRLRTAVLLSVAAAPEVAVRALSGVFGTLQKGAVEGMREGARMAGADETSGMFAPDRLAKGMGELTQYVMDQVGTKPHVAAAAKPFYDSHMILAAERARPYIERGEEVPTGLHPFLDEMKAQQAKVDAAMLREAEQQALGSATRERAPEFYANFAKQQQDMELRIPAEAVRALYGDKPLEGEGPLGYVAKLREQVELSETYGGDVIVPMGDWVAYTDRETMTALKDHVGVGRRGMTLEETKLPAIGETPPEFTAAVKEVEQARKDYQEIDKRFQDAAEGDRTTPEFAAVAEEQRAARERWVAAEKAANEMARPRGPAPAVDAFEADVNAIRELMQVGPRETKLTLARKLPEGKNAAEFGPEQGFHDFELMGAEGKPVGYINLSEQAGGKGLYVDMISGVKGQDVNAFGTRSMMDVLRQVKEHFPEAEWVEGYRVSGARERAGKMAEARIYLNRLFSTPIDQLTQFFEGWGAPAGPEFVRTAEGSAYRVKPIDIAELPQIAQQHVADIQALLDRIAPKGVEARPVAGFAIGKNQANIEGLYSSFQDAKSVIHWALDGRDTAGTARHEAIHHLRANGFLTQSEWQVLERAARESGWVKKHGIDERYESGVHIEEAIAEEFRTWAKAEGKDVGRAQGVFEKIKALLEWIKFEFERAFGKEHSADQIFNAIEEGFVGAREGTKPLREDVFQQAPDREALLAQREALRDERGKLYDEREIARKAGDAAKADELTARMNEISKQTEAILDQLGVQQKTGTLDVTGGRGLAAEPQAAPPFETASAFGSTERNAGRWGKLIAKEKAEDYAKAAARAEKQHKLEQTEQWKTDYAAMRDETTAMVDARPDVAALNALNNRMFLGERLPYALRLDPELVPLDLREALPKTWAEEGGLAPDVLAQMLGYPDGRSMLEAVLIVEQGRRTEGLTFERWRQRQIKRTTDARMEAAYGDLKENIADAKMDQALSETTMQLLHEKTLELAEKANAKARAEGREELKLPLSRDAMVAMARDHFDAQPARGMKPEDFLSKAGKAGRELVDALLASKPLEAFRAQQKQFIATLMAKEAHVWAKEQTRLDRLIRRYTRKEVNTVEAVYADYARDLLQRAGIRQYHSPIDIATGLAHWDYGSIGQFMESNLRSGGELAISPAIQRGEIKPYDEMTVGERKEFRDALQSLDHVGREQGKILTNEGKVDKAELIGKIVDNINMRPKASPKQDGFGRWAAGYNAANLKPEMMLKDLDLQQEMGPLFESIVVPMQEGQARRFDLTDDLVQTLHTVKGMDDLGKAWRKTLDDDIPQNLFVEPESGIPFAMTRSNLIKLMLNWGTRSSREAVARGWIRAFDPRERQASKEMVKAYEEKITELIHKHANKEDWKYVVEMWKPFQKWKPMSDALYRNLSGTAPKWLDSEVLTTKFGDIEGQYFPLIYDKHFSNIDTKKGGEAAEPGVFGADHKRSTTNNGYIVERTSYTDYVSFMYDNNTLAARMQQVIHDITMREAVINTGKILFDQKFQAAVRRHYGQPYLDNLKAWHQRVARDGNLPEKELVAFDSFLKRARLNLVSSALPFSPTVWLSPGMGTLNLKAAGRFLADRNTNMKFVLENSREVKHAMYKMDRDFRELLEETMKSGKYNSAKRRAIEIGYSWATWGDRQFRAVTFYDKYNEYVAQGRTHNEAVQLADAVVRERHGAASLVDLPSIMAASEGYKAFTVFGGFFNSMYNWAEQGVGHAKAGRFKEAGKAFWGTIGLMALTNYAIFQKRTENENELVRMAKAIVSAPLQLLPFVREGVSLVSEGFTPRTPVHGGMQTVKIFMEDVYKGVALDKARKKPISHGAAAVGALTGLPLNSPGRTTQFLVDEARSKQHARDVIEWGRGLWTGEARLPKK